MNNFAPIEAEYQDGYVHSETELDDVSPYVPGKNVFADILNKLPEKEHGKLVRFSLLMPGERHDVDWRGLPDNARPIRFRNLSVDSVNGQAVNYRLNWVHFGYQYTDDAGKSHKDIVELE